MNTEPGSAPDKIVLTTNVQEEATGSFTIGGGYSTDDGALIDLGLNEKNLIGTGIDAGITGVLAQRASQIDLSVTDPYFLDRNLLLGGELFDTTNNNLDISQYEESRTGFTVRTGYAFNNFLSQTIDYSLVDRDVFDVETDASLYVKNESGWSLLSQVGQTITLDHRDSGLDPHSGYILRLGTDVAGLGREFRLCPVQDRRGLLHPARLLQRRPQLEHRASRRSRLPLPLRRHQLHHRQLLPRRREYARLPGRRRRTA